MLVVDSLLRDDDDLSDVARTDWGEATSAEIKRERRIAGMALKISSAISNAWLSDPPRRFHPGLGRWCGKEVQA